MPRKVKTKYTLRSDGRIVATKKYGDTRKSFYGHSDAEVDAKIAAYEKSLAASSMVLFGNVADAWWERKQQEISPSTVHGYRVAVERCKERFGEVPVAEIAPLDCYQFLDYYAKRGFSQKVVTNTRSILKSILDESLLSGDIKINPVVQLPLVRGKPKVKRKPAANDDIPKILAASADFPIGSMYCFLLFSGLRRGEAIALQWKHIDFENKLITVEQSCAFEFDYKPVIKTPKTEAGTRKVVLLDAAMSALPPKGKAEDYVFFPGGLPYKNTFERWLTQYRKKYDISATPHQLRHWFASLGHAAGLDAKSMQTELGHANISMTMDVYTSVTDAAKSASRDKLNEYITETVFTP